MSCAKNININIAKLSKYKNSELDARALTTIAIIGCENFSCN